MKTILEKKINDVTYIGIALAKDWYEGMKYDHPIRDDDFVVCQWSDYHDGQKSNIEGKITLGICHDLIHAKSIYNSINSMSIEVKVHTDIGILTAILVKDDKQGGYTIFFKEKEWDNLTAEGNTIDDSITNLLNLFETVREYKKNRKFATDFGQWIFDSNVKSSSAVQGNWHHPELGYIKDTEALYDIFVKDFSKVEFNIEEKDNVV